MLRSVELVKGKALFSIIVSQALAQAVIRTIAKTVPARFVT